MNPRDWNLQLTAAVALRAASAKRRPAFSVRVYSGGPMQPEVPRLDAPIVVNLAAVTARRTDLPVLLDHRQDADAIVGQTTAIEISQAGIDVAGILTGGDVDGTAAARVVALARDGFQWRASIGMKIGELDYVADGASVNVNGRTLAGPLYVAQSGVLYEISFLSIGADDDAAVRIAAGRQKGGRAMTFTEWLQANGFQVDALNNADRRELLAMYQKDNPPAPTAGQRAAGELRARWDALDHDTRNDPRVASAYGLALCGQMEMKEFDGICRAAAGRDRDGPPQDHSSRSVSIDNAQRPTRGAKPRETLAAAFLLHTGQQAIAEKAFGEGALQAAADLRIRHAMDLVAASVRFNPMLNGVPLDDREMIRAALGPSTYSMPSALGLAGEKLMAEIYAQLNLSWGSWCGRKSVKSFREHTAIRPYLTDGTFEQVAPSGELKHATAGEETYTHKADTYGRMFTVDRRDFINDDLGVFTELFIEIARQAPRKLSDLIYTLLLDNTGSFFGVGNNNYDNGGDTALGIESLSAAIAMLRKQKDGGGKPIGLVPRVLLVAPELEATALMIVNSELLSRAATSDNEPTANPWKGKLTVEVEPRLSDTDFHASASTAPWWLFAGPANPCIVVSFLNGAESPIVEQIDVGANILGFGFRAYQDFGASQADSRAGVMFAGE